jgi:hypothetical protein
MIATPSIPKYWWCRRGKAYTPGRALSWLKVKQHHSVHKRHHLH